MSPKHPPVGPRHRLRRLLKPLALTAALILTPLLAGVVNGAIKLRSASAPPAFTGSLPAPPVHDPTKLTAVIVAGVQGTEATDLLAPYEILAASGAFNVYTAAPERRLTPLFPGSPNRAGVDMIPHYALAEYDRQIGTPPGPDRRALHPLDGDPGRRADPRLAAAARRRADGHPQHLRRGQDGRRRGVAGGPQGDHAPEHLPHGGAAAHPDDLGPQHALGRRRQLHLLGRDHGGDRRHAARGGAPGRARDRRGGRPQAQLPPHPLPG